MDGIGPREGEGGSADVDRGEGGQGADVLQRLRRVVAQAGAVQLVARDDVDAGRDEAGAGLRLAWGEDEAEGGAAGFERRLSAMTGLLASPAAGRPRVLLVVPPAFDVLPGCGCVAGAAPCEHAADARVLAERVVRVADAHGVETVDLFTAFQTAPGGLPLVLNGQLTPAGRALAEQVIERKLALP